MIKIMGVVILCAVTLAGCVKEEPASAGGQNPEPQSQPVSAGQMATLSPTGTVAPVVPARLGDPAHPLVGLAYVKGEPLTIEPGTVYVVEFWATWCPPCRTSIPHLTELQKKYEDQGVVFVGISDENVPTVKPFVADLGDKMDYHVAVDTVGQVVNGYMGAFRQGSIPTAFVVDAKGKVVWYGHPLDIDPILDRVVAGTYRLPG